MVPLTDACNTRCCSRDMMPEHRKNPCIAFCTNNLSQEGCADWLVAIRFSTEAKYIKPFLFRLCDYVDKNMKKIHCERPDFYVHKLP